MLRSSIYIMDLPALRSFPFYTVMNSPRLWRASWGDSMLTQKWTCPHEQRAGLRLPWWPTANCSVARLRPPWLVLRATKCWHGTDIRTNNWRTTSKHNAPAAGYGIETNPGVGKGIREKEWYFFCF